MNKPLSVKNNRDLLQYTFIFIFLFVVLSGCMDFSDDPRMCTSVYTYEISINTEQPVTDVTLLIPLPLQTGFPKFESLYLNKSLFEKYHEYPAEINNDSPQLKDTRFVSDYPDDYQANIITFDNGTFLKFTADSLVPEKPVDCAECAGSGGRSCACMASISVEEAYESASALLAEAGCL